MRGDGEVAIRCGTVRCDKVGWALDRKGRPTVRSKARCWVATRRASGLRSRRRYLSRAPPLGDPLSLG